VWSRATRYAIEEGGRGMQDVEEGEERDDESFLTLND
jgi:hypothetical protein